MSAEEPKGTSPGEESVSIAEKAKGIPFFIAVFALVAGAVCNLFKLVSLTNVSLDWSVDDMDHHQQSRRSLCLPRYYVVNRHRYQYRWILPFPTCSFCSCMSLDPFMHVFVN